MAVICLGGKKNYLNNMALNKYIAIEKMKYIYKCATFALQGCNRTPPVND
jgi:hypothetical protein